MPDHDDPDSSDILHSLNPVQREAVTHHDGPLLVVAGAGSGKTRVLTHRIAHLIQDHGISPFEILAITFTNKAAAEMKSRVGALVGPVAEKMWVSTFHSACVRILRRDAAKLEYPSSFTIYDQADAVRLTSYVIRDLGLDPKKFPPRSVHAAISMAKNDNIGAAVFRERAGAIFERKIADVYVEYQQRLRKAGAMDFDDLLMVTARLFREHPDVLEHYRRRFKHILVDEYQDTNTVQNELVIQLASEHRNICIVGDTDQSIYSISRRRHAQHPRSSRRRFLTRTVIVLEQNYRSTQTILDAANAVIANNFGRKPKELWTDSGAGQAIVRYHADDESDESQWVAHEISRLHDEGERWGDVAVFYRTNAMSRVIEEQLMRLGIPYKVVGGTRFYDRREVKDALAYMKAVVNPVDEVSVKRVINVPKRGVGDSTVGKLDAWATAHGVAFIDALRRADDAGVNGPAVKGIAEFLDLLDELNEAQSEGPGRLLELILERTGYVAELQAGTLHRVRRPAGEPGRARRCRPRVRERERVPRAGVAGRRHRRLARRRRRHVGRADDVARGEGARVPVGVPRRHGRRRVPAPAFARRAGRARGGAPARRMSASPAPASGCTSRTRGAGCSTGRRSTTRRAGSSTRSRPSC